MMPAGVALGFLAAVLVLTRLATRDGSRNVLLVVAAFFTYFAFGPVINLALGNPVYAGIELGYVGTASAGFGLALLGFALGDALAPQRRVFDGTLVSTSRRVYPVLPLVYLVLSAYGLLVIATRFPFLLSGQKLLQLAAAGGLHYPYLLLQLVSVSTYFMARQTRLATRLWWLSCGVYVLYCLLTSERDFFFVLLAILVHRELFRRKRRPARTVALAAAAVVAATALFTVRKASTLSLGSVLNQGSILFVDTFLIQHVPRHLPFQGGGTYLDALLRLVPGAGDAGNLTPSEWLVRVYAPDGGSGYGFSLTGEAYMNFGMLGIPAVTLVMTLAHRWVLNRCDQSDGYLYLSVYGTAVWMYALRGDSTQLVSSLLYGTLFFAVVHATSSRRQGARGGPVFGVTRDRPPPGEARASARPT